MKILPVVSLDGEWVNASHVRISPLGDGFMFGRGVFETIRVLSGRPVFVQAHLARISRSAAAVGLQWEPVLADVAARCEELVRLNELSEGSLKLVVFADVDGVSELMVARDFVYPEAAYSNGFSVAVTRTESCTLMRPAAAGHKVTSYLKNLLARETARGQGHDETLFVGAADQVIEGSASNVFIVRNGEVLTPPVEAGVLPGIVRAEILKRCGGRVREQNFTLAELKSADEVFLTNALMGVMPVRRVDDRTYAVDGYVVTPELMRRIAEWARE
jgi:branched-subunit amino acid aminotransferase/4-amino-4-deoxychorismate lyase